MAKKKNGHLLLLLFQILITLLYGSAIIHMTITLFVQNRDFFVSGLLGYISQAIILVVSLAPQIVLRLKRKIHSQGGDIYPLLFTMSSLQASLILPQYSQITGVYLFDISFLLIIERFSMVGTASIFLLSALRFYGLANSRINFNTFLVLGASLIVCMIAPINTQVSSYNPFSSQYDAYLQLVTLLLYIATCATMIITVFKDKTASNIKRCISFIFMIIGIYLALSASFIPVLLGALFYVVGIILLISSTQESF